MARFPSFPREVESILGSASQKFVDYLHESLTVEKEDTITMSIMSFENRLGPGISAIHLKIADLCTELKTDIAGVRTEIAEVRTELKTDIAEVRTEISEVRIEIAQTRAELKSDITSQTKWLLVGLALAVTLYPVISRLMIRLIPL